MSGNVGAPTRMKGARAGRSAPPTPCYRVAWPGALKRRLKAAGVKTEAKPCKGNARRPPKNV